MKEEKGKQSLKGNMEEKKDDKGEGYNGGE